MRFHPLSDNHRLLEGTMDIVYDRESVFIDLSRTEEELFDRYHPGHQRNVRKALKSGLEFRALEGHEALQQLEAFYRLYRATMDKVGALPYYYFSTEYLERLFSRLGRSALLGAVFLDGRMISAALCLREGDVLTYHLGASEAVSLHLGTNTFQFHHIALWARRNGLRVFHLGGGHRGGTPSSSSSTASTRRARSRSTMGRRCTIPRCTSDWSRAGSITMPSHSPSPISRPTGPRCGCARRLPIRGRSPPPGIHRARMGAATWPRQNSLLPDE
ncbi:GNAT family N-acetyltransferase [Cystobacter fuscus]